MSQFVGNIESYILLDIAVLYFLLCAINTFRLGVYNVYDFLFRHVSIKRNI